MTSSSSVFPLLVQLCLGALAAFLAIISWTRTRRLSWMLVISGILALYAGTLFRALALFGLFSGSEIQVFGASLGQLISEGIPLLLFIAAFTVFIRENR